MFHMIALEQTFVNGSLQKFFLLLLPFQIESILCCLCPQRRLNQRSGLSQKCPMIIWFPMVGTNILCRIT